jgi:hypothetical protein
VGLRVVKETWRATSPRILAHIISCRYAMATTKTSFSPNFSNKTTPVAADEYQKFFNFITSLKDEI